MFVVKSSKVYSLTRIKFEASIVMLQAENVMKISMNNSLQIATWPGIYLYVDILNVSKAQMIWDGEDSWWGKLKPSLILKFENRMLGNLMLKTLIIFKINIQTILQNTHKTNSFIRYRNSIQFSISLSQGDIVKPPKYFHKIH